MASLRFDGLIEINGVNPFVRVSSDQIDALKPGWKGPLPVLITVNGKPDIPWPINMMPMGTGDFYLYLHGDVRKSSGTVVGDTVHVSIEFDESYRGGPDQPPEWFLEALTMNPDAATNWARLPPSRQKEVVRTLLRLKSAAARERHLLQAISVLSGKDGHYISRDRADGR